MERPLSPEASGSDQCVTHRVLVGVVSLPAMLTIAPCHVSAPIFHAAASGDPRAVHR
jgi:hypothetical protein